jgi:hypothetical protein
MEPSSSSLNDKQGTGWTICGERCVFSIEYDASIENNKSNYISIIRKAPNPMNLDKFLNMKPRTANEKMEIENPEKQPDLPWVEK